MSTMSEVGSDAGVTGALAGFISGLRWEALPWEVRARAVSHLSDTMAAILAGMGEEVSRAVLALAVQGEGLALPAGAGRVSAPGLALACGTAAHGIELDDGYRQGSVHPGVSVVPALLALAGRLSAEGRPVDGRRFLTALVAGYEVICGMAEAGHPHLRRRGFHPTSAVGPLGAAAAGASLLGFDAERCRIALGFAASGCGGLFAFLGGGADVKRLHGGMAARAGVEAVLLAEAGISAPEAVIEAPSGWASAFTGAEVLLPLPPARDFRILDCYIKPHACCRHLQPAFEAVVEVMREQGLEAQEVSRIEVETYGISAHHASVGWGTFADAQLSFPYLIALALHHGDAQLSRFDARHRGAGFAEAVAARLEIRAAPDLDARYPAERPARVALHARGQVFRRERAEASGTREEPVGAADLAAKFRGLVDPVLGAARGRALHAALAALADAPDAAVLLELSA